LRSHCGAQRKVFNWGLAQIKDTVAQHEAERSYGITAEELAPSLTWSAYLLRGLWNHRPRVTSPFRKRVRTCPESAGCRVDVDPRRLVWVFPWRYPLPA
jgi:hypothetical protein